MYRRVRLTRVFEAKLAFQLSFYIFFYLVAKLSEAAFTDSQSDWGSFRCSSFLTWSIFTCQSSPPAGNTFTFCLQSQWGRHLLDTSSNNNVMLRKNSHIDTVIDHIRLLFWSVTYISANDLQDRKVWMEAAFELLISCKLWNDFIIEVSESPEESNKDLI